MSLLSKPNMPFVQALTNNLLIKPAQKLPNKEFPRYSAVGFLLSFAFPYLLLLSLAFSCFPPAAEASEASLARLAILTFLWLFLSFPCFPCVPSVSLAFSSFASVRVLWHFLFECFPGVPSLFLAFPSFPLLLLVLSYFYLR